MSTDTTGSDCNVASIARELVLPVLSEFYGTPFWQDEQDMGPNAAYTQALLQMLQGHVLGGTLSLPDGHLYTAGDFLSSGMCHLQNMAKHGINIYSIYVYTGWWFGTFFIFPYIGDNNPN
jgi:hypothetical protein